MGPEAARSVVPCTPAGVSPCKRTTAGACPCNQTPAYTLQQHLAPRLPYRDGGQAIDHGVSEGTSGRANSRRHRDQHLAILGGGHLALQQGMSMQQVSQGVR
jgi:hypothetical protein